MRKIPCVCFRIMPANRFAIRYVMLWILLLLLFTLSFVLLVLFVYKQHFLFVFELGVRLFYYFFGVRTKGLIAEMDPTGLHSVSASNWIFLDTLEHELLRKSTLTMSGSLNLFGSSRESKCEREKRCTIFSCFALCFVFVFFCRFVCISVHIRDWNTCEQPLWCIILFLRLQYSIRKWENRYFEIYFQKPYWISPIPPTPPGLHCLRSPVRTFSCIYSCLFVSISR